MEGLMRELKSYIAELKKFGRSEQEIQETIRLLTLEAMGYLPGPKGAPGTPGMYPKDVVEEVNQVSWIGPPGAMGIEGGQVERAINFATS